MNVEPDSRVRFEKARIIVQIRSRFLIGLCEHVMMDRNHFNMASDMAGKVSEELVVNRMLSRAFFAFLHLDELLEGLVSIHGRKNSLRARLSQDFLIS